ncbi:hypothetical protein ACFRFS_11540, partial [Streptomyces sp. NPDC056730]
MPYEAPTHTVERSLRATTEARIIAGVDEVGRGAWAGPVTVCAAVTGLRRPPAGLTDSKLISPKRRTGRLGPLGGGRGGSPGGGGSGGAAGRALARTGPVR